VKLNVSAVPIVFVIPARCGTGESLL